VGAQLVSDLNKKIEFFHTTMSNLENSTDRNWIGKLSHVGANFKQLQFSRLQLLTKLNAARELERRRLARDLHDQMGQDLIALTLGLRSLKDDVGDTPERVAQFEQIQAIVSNLNQQLHSIAWDLRPLILDDLGLHEALIDLVDKLSASISINIDLQSITLSKLKLSKFKETVIYRITQEALTNVFKHANASDVLIMLNVFQNKLILNIADNGCGFDTSSLQNEVGKKGCFGLQGIFERVELLSGTFNILSSPNEGTVLRISIPINSRRKR